MCSAEAVSGVGLVCDVIGAVPIRLCGLPPPVSRTGAVYLILERCDEAEKARAGRYDRYARLGIGLLVFGFLLQLVADHV